MILDGVPDQAGNHPTLLLKAGNKAIIARCVDVEKLHGHVSLVERTAHGVDKSPINQEAKAMTSSRVK